MKPKKKFKKRYVIIPLILVMVVVFVLTRGNNQKQGIGYREEAVTVRDLVSYLEFSGSVTTAETKSIFAEVQSTVTDVLVEEGDEVKKGDVICILDSSDIEYSIEAKELSIAQAKLQNAYSLKDAQTSLANLEDSIATGNNQSINQAQKSVVMAQEQFLAAAENYNTARKNYEEAKKDYEEERTQSIVTAKQSFDSANKTLDEKYRSVKDLGWDDEKMDEFLRPFRESVESARTNLQFSRDNARKQAESLKENCDKAQESYEKAQVDLAAAQKDYEVVLYNIEQNRQSYINTIEKLQATMSTESSELDLEHTKEALADYIVTSPIDGFVTSLSVKKNEKINMASPLGVISNFDEMEISINIDEYDLAAVKEGTKVEVYINALDKYYDGEIKSLAKTATKAGDVSFVNAIVSFEPDEIVMCGLSAEVKLIKMNEKNVLTLSEKAISYEADHTAYVMMKNEKGEGVKTPVTLGVSNGEYVQILDGLNENDVVMYTEDILPMMYMSVE